MQYKDLFYAVNTIGCANTGWNNKLPYKFNFKKYLKENFKWSKGRNNVRKMQERFVQRKMQASYCTLYTCTGLRIQNTSSNIYAAWNWEVYAGASTSKVLDGVSLLINIYGGCYVISRNNEAVH